MGRGGKTALSRDERVLCDRLRQITPQSRLLRVDEAVHMLRDMYAEYRRRTVASLTELVRRATDAIAADFVPRPVARVPVPAIPAAQEPAQPAPTRAPSTPSPAPGASSGASAAPSPAPPSSTASSPAAAAQPPRDAAAEARAREKRLEEAGSVLNRALVERYKAQHKRPREDESSAAAKRTQRMRREVTAAVARTLPEQDDVLAGVGGSGSSRVAPTPRPAVRYRDVGGAETVLQDVRELIEYPLTHPEIYRHLGVDPPRGILLHGPPGCGKTLLANAIAGELGVRYYCLAAPEIVSGMSGESEAKLRALFAEAAAHAPCIVFIDEIDAITPKRETAQREMERRIVAQLLACLDSLGNPSSSSSEGGGADQGDPIEVDDDGNDGNGAMEAPGVPRGPVIVIGATNRPDSIEPALRRAGRFDREIALGIPDAAARARILQVIARRLRLAGDFDFDAIARVTGGFVGADLAALAKEAAVLAVHRIFAELFASRTLTPTPALPEAETKAEATATATATTTTEATKEQQEQQEKQEQQEEKQKRTLEERVQVSDRLREMGEPLSEEQMSGLCITMDDFQQAVKKVQPSAKREGFSSTPNVHWGDVGALAGVRAQLIDAIVGPIRQPELYRAVGIRTSSGVLLFGPPGCGKTLIAKAVANECGANFIGIKGPQLLNKYVGEAERAVRQLFARAATSAPCVIFFDELDALCPRRSGGADGSDSTGASRLVNQLLTEMDGLEARRDVFVIAATNRPDVIDPAMLRPGRLDKLIAVDLPDAAGRAEVLAAICHAQRCPVSPDVDFAAIARDPRCTGFSGADLGALVHDAALQVLHEALAARGIHLDQAAPVDFALHRRDARTPEPQPDIVIRTEHFLRAFASVRRSVSEEDEQLYKALRHSLHCIKGSGTSSSSTPSSSSN